MSNWLWPRSAPLRYGPWQQRSDRLFLALAKRKARNAQGKHPLYLALVPPEHCGLFRARDQRSYRWFPVLKNGYSSVVEMLVHVHGVAARYRSFGAPAPGEGEPEHEVALQPIRVFRRREWVQYPRPIMARFLPERAFAAAPRADIRFCVLRHPRDRFVSVYRNHVHGFQAMKRAGARWRLPYRQLMSPEAFCARVEQDWEARPWEKGAWRGSDGYAYDRHLWPQHYYLGKDSAYFTHIFALGELARVAALLEQLHGAPVRVPHGNRSGNAPLPYLSAALRRRIDALYREDFAIFGRHLPPPQI